jgi:hypothetical protein
MALLGRKRLTFIPLSRTDAQLPDISPPEWIDQIWQGVFFEPGKDLETGQPKPRADRSGRAFIQMLRDIGYDPDRDTAAGKR